MVVGSTLKRLRVRLRATDPDSLAETFGANVYESGVFLKSKQLLPIGTPILFELLYQSGKLALRGRGRVESVSTDPGASGMNLALEWLDESVVLARWVVERSAPDASDPFEDVTVYAGDGPPERWLQREHADEPEQGEAPGERSADPEALIAPALPDGVRIVPGQVIGSVHYLPMDARMPLAVPLGGAPTPPPPPVLDDAPLLGQRPGAQDSWDSVSDSIAAPAPPPRPVSDPRSDPDEAAMEDAFEEPEDWGSSLYAQRTGMREPGEVTPLARIELIRPPPAPELRTGDIEPLVEDEAQAAHATAIPSKRSPSRMPPPTSAIMGIDFGTVNTRAAVPVRKGRPRIIPSRRGTDATPSVVMIRDSGKTTVGEPALRKLPAHPQHGVQEARRLIGLPFAPDRPQGALPTTWCQLVPGDEGETAVRVGPYDVSVEEVAALLLKEVRESALMALEQRVNRAVLTCPIAFGVRQRQALCLAARLAGIYVDRLISEPTAIVAHAMAERPGATGKVFVYRLGGGTFDASIVEVGRDRMEVLGTESELFLGGVDFDAGLGTLIADEVERISGMSPKSSASRMASVLDAARTAKQLLSIQGRASVLVEAPAGTEASFQVEVDISREQAELIWAPLVDRTIALSERLLESAGLTAQHIEGVLLAGGQTRTPLVQRRVRALLGRDPIEMDPEHAAVLGAAEVAARIGTDRELSIRESLSLSLFAAEQDTPLDLVLRSGEPLPTQAVITVKSDETMLCEGLDAESVELIGLVRTDPCAGATAVKFDVSPEGLLSVTAMDLASGRTLAAELVTDLSRLEGAQPRDEDRGLFGWIRKRFKASRASAEK